MGVDVKKNNIMYLGNVSPKNLPYILTWIVYYAWVIVYTTWWTASPLTIAIYHTDVRIIIHSVNLLSSAFFIIILKKEWFSAITRIGTVCLIFSLVLFFLVTLPKLHILIVVLLGISLGIVNIGVLIPFVFVLNNTEKFYAVFVTNLLIYIILLLQETSLINITNGIIRSILMFCLCLLPITRFKKNDLIYAIPKEITAIPKAKKLIYITIAISAIYGISCKGIGKIFMLVAEKKVDLNIGAVFYIGAILGGVICFVTYGFSDNAFVITWNTTFATFVIADILFSIANEGNRTFLLFPLTLGIGSAIGIINTYYIMGVIGKKYYSYTYVKISIVIIGGIGGIGGITGITFGNRGESYIESIAVLIACVSAIVIVILLMLSPTLSRKYFNEEWVADAQKPEIDNEHSYIFEKYRLSKREVEICKLFLEGYTMRQIAGILNLSYATINTYQTSLYRKLNINSKTELLIIFKDYIIK